MYLPILVLTSVLTGTALAQRYPPFQYAACDPSIPAPDPSAADLTWLDLPTDGGCSILEKPTQAVMYRKPELDCIVTFYATEDCIEMERSWPGSFPDQCLEALSGKTFVAAMCRDKPTGVKTVSTKEYQEANGGGET
ncbi:hypothetical protein BDZ85DRAFT_282758 [Elsinoe ampelina]|uniref:Uncharacterized protein n=1 Tax=Elsinoe ampelina TaxID=302913 RepID=A0A6A6GAI6_9PEZI|nr:hypothetical protein BDZ85DRAFT_282758 [Elsinoe ampelina]